MINLTCPSCTAELEIDDGFRGGVCRCFDCGTLMTVPDAPDAGAAETLSRPDSPDAPVLAEIDEEAEFEKTGEFMTSSGHRVRLSSRQLQQVPVARKKRMGVRITVVAFMMSIVLAIIGCIIFGMWVIFAPPPNRTVEDIHKDLYKYDATVNPWIVPRATIYSIPVKEDTESVTILMTDSSSAMRDGYLDWTKHNFWAAIPLMHLDQPVQIVFWHDPAPIVYPSRPTRVKDIPRQLLHKKLTEVGHGGGISAMPAFNRVMRGVAPSQIFCVTHQLPSDTELQRIVGMTQDSGTTLIWIHLAPHAENEYLKATAEDSKYVNYVPIPKGVITKWYVDEYLTQRNGPLLHELDPANKDDRTEDSTDTTDSESDPVPEQKSDPESDANDDLKAP